jgi:EAL domain-containing protein (putative c-di-GMP-specific phosphodiesterase class I)/GGDEF domain-containing protein
MLGQGEPAALGQESKWLAELLSLEDLLTSSDGRFDRYTEFAARAFDARIAVLVLLDNEQLYLKSIRGLEPSDALRHESFAARVLLQPELLVVPDTELDTWFSRHPLVAGDPHVKFFAGVVIRHASGRPLGALCIMDTHAREFPDSQKDLLRHLGTLVEHDIETLDTIGDLRERIQAHAFLDPSSGLPNQDHFTGKLGEWIALAPDEPVIVTLIRVDRYDGIYSAVGKAGATYLMEEFVLRVQNALDVECLLGQLREDTIGLAYRIREAPTENVVLDELLQAIGAPIWLGSHRILLRVHIGVAMYPNDAANAETLMKRARTALHAHPPHDTTSYRRYDPQLSAEAARSFEIESALKGALERNELELVFQPKIRLSSCKLAGAEALLRWNNETLGAVSPSEFIPIAEQSGLIVDLGTWVIEQACRQLSEWSEQANKCPEVSINISSYQLRRPEFCDVVEHKLRRSSLASTQLNLELTESSLIHDIDEAIAIMQRLQYWGVTFSIDDFGKGFSSLSYLRKMPVQALKIDRQFVEHFPEDRNDTMLVQSIIAMGHALGLKVVAEGVERTAQLKALQQCGCDEVQGFLFGRPVRAEDFAKKYLLPRPQARK